MTRRRFLSLSAALWAAACGQRQDDDRRSVERFEYGGAPRQFVELSVPRGDGPFPVVVLVHGGFWSSDYRLDLMAPLRDDLAAGGVHAVVNVEYRSVGDEGGGWPGTLDDVAAAVDALVGDDRLDLDAVTAVGHSAGGQLAAWLGARGSLAPPAPGAGPAVVPGRVVSLAGVLDLVAAADLDLGDGACQAYLGGGPDDVPERYAVASPAALLPFAAEVVCIHGRGDAVVPLAQSADFVEAAVASGGAATLHAVDGDHFDVIDPAHPSWQLARDALLT